MHKLKRRFVTLFIGAATFFFAQAADPGYQLRDIGIEFLGTPDTPTILFVNGLNNTKTQAADSSEALIEALHAQGLPYGKYNIYSFYNPTEGVVSDVLGEAANQIQWSNEQLKRADGAKEAYYKLLGSYYIERVASTATLPPSVGRIEKLADRLAREMERILESSPSLVVVAHSQGNLYVEAAYAMLVAKNRSDLTAKIRVVGVAPASATTPSDRYVLSTEDKIITRDLKGLALKFSLGTFTPLPANVEPCTAGPTTCGDQIDWSRIDQDGHDFKKVYLSDALKTSTTSTPLPRIVYNLVRASLDELGATTPEPTVNSASCTAPVVGQTMTCSVFGTNLPSTVNFTATNCAPRPMVAVTGGTGNQRQFTCTPQQGGDPVQVSYLVPGFIGPLPKVVFTPFNEQFAGTTFDTSKWNSVGAGTVVVSDGVANFACRSSLSTEGKYVVAGETIVIEARMAGTGPLRDTVFALYEEGGSSIIQAGDTNYGGVGLYLFGTGSFALPQTGNGTSTSAFKEYRLTLSGRSAKIERGDTLDAISESVTRDLASSISGRTFYLLVGTGGPDYCPGTVDWVTVTTH